VPARTPTFYGQVSGGQAAGFFIMPNITMPGQTITTAPKDSFFISFSVY
jgi:hypothetical protein